MIDAFRDDYGVDVLHAWGMTELSPLGTLCTLKNKHLKLPAPEQMKIRLKQGRAIFGIDMKIVDGSGQDQPHDGKAYGDLLVRGPWIVDSYFKGRAKVLINPPGFKEYDDLNRYAFDVAKAKHVHVPMLDNGDYL